MAVCVVAIWGKCPGGKGPGRVFFSGGNCPEGTARGGTVRMVMLSGGELPERNCPGGNLLVTI